MKILLVNPRAAYTDPQCAVQDIPFMKAKALAPPYGIAIIAGLTPREHEIAVHDEFVSGDADERMATGGWDIIGFSFLNHQASRTRELAAVVRQRNISAHVVLGGMGMSALSPELAGMADTLVFGEAEYIWPKFLEDFSHGRARKVYHQLTKPALHDIPPPRWDLFRETASMYVVGPVQTTRGCVHDCSYCTVITNFGRRIRTKPIPQVLAEVQHLADLGFSMIFFFDDNFVANRRYAKELLRSLIPVNRQRRLPLTFLTQVDILTADDDDLLELLADCNFAEVEVGIESFDHEVLGDYAKDINTRGDMVAKLQKIQSYGIIVMANLMAGADSDRPGSIARAAEAGQRSNAAILYLHPLTLLKGTPLWYQANREGRLLVNHPTIEKYIDMAVNFVPKNMDRAQLIDETMAFWRQAYRPEAFLARALHFIAGVKRVPQTGATSWRLATGNLPLFTAVLSHFAFHETPELRKVFFSILLHGAKRGSWMVDRTQYMFQRFYYENSRNNKYLEMVQALVEWEADNPAALLPGREEEPIPYALLQKQELLVRTAWELLMPQAESAEAAYGGIVRAVLKLIDSHPEPSSSEEQVAEQLRRLCQDLPVPREQTTPCSDEIPRLSARESKEIVDIIDMMRRVGLNGDDIHG